MIFFDSLKIWSRLGELQWKDLVWRTSSFDGRIYHELLSLFEASNHHLFILHPSCYNIFTIYLHEAHTLVDALQVSRYQEYAPVPKLLPMVFIPSYSHRETQSENSSLAIYPFVRVSVTYAGLANSKHD